jgi:hypothetical protein
MGGGEQTKPARKRELIETEPLSTTSLAGKIVLPSPTKADSIISHLKAKCYGNFHEKAPITSVRDAAAFPGSPAKTPNTSGGKIMAIWPVVDRSPGKSISRIVQELFGCEVGPPYRKIR